MEDLPVEAGMGENGGASGEKDDEFYETIEAPKFVDFTLPILPLLEDDRSWFCSRVGCDQKHEQDMDSETIYRNFVLRVMAARSPNVKLGKAFSKQLPIGIPKCPLSAPPKSSRVPKLAVISSISQIHGAKVKVTHISSKFMPTPIGKKSQGNKEKVQEPCGNVVKSKMTSLKEKKKEVVKALVFSSPGKKGKQGTSITSVANITSEMKKLKISRQAKIVPSRYASSSAQAKPSSNACIAKSKQVRSSIASKDTGNQKAILVRKKTTGKGKEEKSNGKLSGNKRDVKKFDGNMVGKEKASRNSARVLDAIGEECLLPMETSIEKEKIADTRNGSSIKETNLAMAIANFDNANESCVESTFLESTDLIDATEDSMPLIREEGNGVCEINKQVIETETMESADKESTAASYCNSMPLIREEGNGVCEINKQVAETETMESADKENTAASDCNRNINLNSIDAERSTKQLKEGVLVPNQGGKIKKVKPTNPKPFRLRTDERSILKEANLEKRRLLQPIVSSYYAPDSKINNENTKDEKHMQVQARSANVKSTGRKAAPKADNRAILNIKNEGKNITTKRTENRPANSEQLTGTASSDKNSKCSVSKNQMCDSIRSTSRGKRPPTIPKEPVFHQIHVPKSCTKNKI